MTYANNPTGQTPPAPGPEAGRRLDGEVHIKLGNTEWDTYNHEYWEENGEEKEDILLGYTADDVPSYSTDISAAWTVVEFMKTRGYTFHVYEDDRPGHGNYWVAGFRTRDNSKPSGGSQYTGDTAPLAICLAFLALPDEVKDK